MTKVKICGITNLEDALLSVKFGADALGFNFYEKSPRCVEPEHARAIGEHLPAGILKVGVFVNEALERVVEIAREARLDALQLHGEESADFARELKARTELEIIKAFRVSPDFRPEDVTLYEVDAILLDAYRPEEHGGTGETFDWEVARRVQQLFPEMYLAGGLTHENVMTAVYAPQGPKVYGVDTCSGVEREKGKKDRVKLINFLSKIRNYSAQLDKFSSGEEYRKPENLYDLLTRIHARPAAYFGEKSLSKLQLFLDGFFVALHVTNAHFNLNKYDTEEFRKWMGERVGYGYPNTIDNMTHILRKFDGDEARAFDYFFALLEEFKLERDNQSHE